MKCNEKKRDKTKRMLAVKNKRNILKNDNLSLQIEEANIEVNNLRGKL